MWIRLVQVAIVAAVIASNIQWHWTPSGLLAMLAGIGAAFVLTVVPVGIYHEIRILLAQRPTRGLDKRLEKRGQREASAHALRPSRQEPYPVEPWDRQE